jgi:hypothetical protein
MQEDQNQEITLINTRGRVVRVKRWEVPLCREQGMKIIVNPKQEYYPEFDSENQRYTPPTDNLVENIAEEDLLEVEQL